MSIFDIIGPVMVGPSSSHTAGAVQIGLVSRKLLQDEVVFADIRFHGSFASTYKGHGTDRAVTAGLLGMQSDDVRIAESLNIADAISANDAISFSGVEYICRDIIKSKTKSIMIAKDSCEQARWHYS